MTRLFLVLAALLALLGLAVPASAAPDWSASVSKLPNGSFLIGNPKAKVKLVEYVSYTCPHCAAFMAESAKTLRGGFVRSGSTSIEVRHAIRDRADLAATHLARCAGPAGFTGMTDAMFAQQDNWLTRAMKYDDINGERIANYPINSQLRSLAIGAGLLDLARARGMSDAAFNACYADMAGIEALVKIGDASWDAIKGTPSFAVNGKLVEFKGWPDLEKTLRAAGAK